MTDIHVVDRHNIDLYEDVMESYFRIRHDIFVGERQWMALYNPDGREIDKYDDEEAIYILAIDDGKVVGGQRLYPTVRPHMISEVFPHLVDRRLPVGEQTYEWTRYFIVRERRRTPVDAMLLAGVQKYCLDEGISDLTAVGEMWWLPRWHQYGFIVHPLGLPQMIEGQPTLAVRIEISEDSYENVLRVGGLQPSTLARTAITQPPAGPFPHAA